MDRLGINKPADPINALKYGIIAVMVLLLLGAGGVAYAWANKTVNIQVAEQISTVKTTGKTVADVLKSEKITTTKYDIITPGPATPLVEGMKIVVDRAIPVTIYHDGKQQKVWTHEKTVSKVLEKAGVKLGKLDKVSPALETPITTATTKIAISRVKENIIETSYIIPFGLERKNDASMLRGMRKIVSRGATGLGKKVVKVTYMNGKEANRVVVKTLVVKQPKNQIMAVGTVRTVSRGGKPLNFKDSIIMGASGYTHTGYRTSTGKIPVRGVAAVDPSVIPMGTRVYVDGYGYAIAADRGSAIVGNRIDLFFDTVSEARRWGRRNVRVYILE